MNKISKKIAKVKRVWLQFRMLTIRDGWNIAKYLNKRSVFQHFGKNCYYAPIILPAKHELVCLNYNAVISAGAVVTKDIEVNSVVAGVPEKIISSYNEVKDKVLKYSGILCKKGYTSDAWVSELTEVESLQHNTNKG